ncbi:rhamnose/proton symporter RhaT [Polaribacter reichenbachii]|uniref:Rhamnose:proton symporter n=1 Tax=Polaribacter reichenbachii TaxID=996801 RepID=A0A1B8TVG4_9FLAO|nr:L-rhamnose/proton symporter RhaT [Polaribacter reichenbachii]APZ45509.1 rhamnose/proton symporter RhaT [Polaribacter reichenbachii]AUC19370.1 rhamnose/proton symporter RhaT [Polaribacter reichenbachii]OBY63475.1 rhamnose:proton symporter [Polaribacter reichenbachii]
MIEGVLLAIFAGLMLGLYALPEKFTKDFKYENTWSLFFLLTMFVVPIVASVSLISGFGDIFGNMPSDIWIKMGLTSFLWGIGVMMWGKAINHIGLSLGFSLFIGTILLVGSLLPYLEEDLPATNIFTTILVGLFVVLIGVFANGKAGLIREKDEAASGEQKDGKGSMVTGILIAVIGGLLATGFSYANAAGRPYLHEASQAAGNPEWVTAVAVMFPIFLSGGIVMTAYFLWQLSQKKAWGSFKTPAFGKNFVLILVMAVFHYAASALFAYAAYKLGESGNTVGYAIFNTACVVTAIVSGLITKEWVKASNKAKSFLYFGLICMVVGIVIVAYSNSLK